MRIRSSIACELNAAYNPVAGSFSAKFQIPPFKDKDIVPGWRSEPSGALKQVRNCQISGNEVNIELRFTSDPDDPFRLSRVAFVGSGHTNTFLSFLAQLMSQ